MKRWTMIALLGWMMALAPATLLAQQTPADPGNNDTLKLQQDEAADLAAQIERKTRTLRLDAERLQAKAAQDAAMAADRVMFARRAFQQPTGKMEKVAYCGVSTVPVTPALTAQLKLTPEMGLLVDFVEPNSPAEMAGIKQYDILTQFNDQLLANPEQLRVLVRLKMLSDDVKFSIIRQGQPISVNVELGQKEVEVQPEADAQTAHQDKMYAFGHDGQLMIDRRAVNASGGGGGMAITNVAGKNQMVWSDAQKTLNLDLEQGKAVRLIARDRTGKELFSGPVKTEEERKALPIALAEGLRKAEAGGPLRVARDGNKSRVLTSTDNDTLMLARFENHKATHVFAFSTADGKTLFDGPTGDDAQRKAMPQAVAKQLELLEQHQEIAGEFGVVGRDGF
jgi:membrane-associated protease RseP (regulator of RpoE activity)